MNQPHDWQQRFRSIVFEGPVGAGKSTLARQFSERFGYQILMEAPEDNPFLPRFYVDSARFALPTQLFFLFQRVDQLRSLAQRDLFAEHLVSDFMIEKDRLFAQLTLDADELALYDKIYSTLRPHVPAPDLVVVLQAQPADLLARVRQRGIEMEQNLSVDYLRRLSEAYTQFFHYYEEAPVLVVNTSSLNPVGRMADFEALIAQIAQFRGRRAYFNFGS